MFQDLKNKAYAVSFKAGSIGKGGHKGERGSSGRGEGRRPGLFTRQMFIWAPLEWQQMFLYKLSATFLSTINVKIKMVMPSATEPENTKPKSDMNLGRNRQIIK